MFVSVLILVQLFVSVPFLVQLFVSVPLLVQLFFPVPLFVQLSVPVLFLSHAVFDFIHNLPGGLTLYSYGTSVFCS